MKGNEYFIHKNEMRNKIGFYKNKVEDKHAKFLRDN